MNRVGEFEKVSFEQFYEAMKAEFYEEQKMTPGLLLDIEHSLKAIWEDVQLPSRATSGSAGYDFKAPFSFSLRAGDTIKIPTGIRVKIDDGWWLACLPRSGLGFKYRVALANTCGVIDSDYYHSDNEGHIFVKLVNNGDKDLSVGAGDGFMQALFLPYGITHSDSASAVRNGGMGSTGK